MLAIPDNRYLLIELGAARPSARRQFQALLSPDATQWLFDGTPEHELRAHGPVLIDRRHPAHHAIQPQLVQWCERYPALLAGIDSPLAVDALANWLRPWLDIVLPSGERQLFRFHFGPVFSLLNHQLAGTEAARLFHGMDAWHWWDAQQEVWRTEQPRARQTFDSAAWLFRPSSALWRQIAFESALRRTWQVLQAMPEHDWLLQLATPQRYALLEQQVRPPLAASHLGNESDLTALGALVLNYPEVEVLAAPALQPALESARQHPGSLQEALNNLDLDTALGPTADSSH